MQGQKIVSYKRLPGAMCRHLKGHSKKSLQGQKIVSYYEVKTPDHMDLFCEWLGIEERSLLYVMSRHRNTAYWDEVEPDVWSRRAKIDIPSVSPEHRNLRYPQCMNLMDGSSARQYITIGKGVDWPARTEDSQIINNWL